MKDMLPVGEGYKQRTINAMNVAQSVRGIEMYAGSLGFSNPSQFLRMIPEGAIVLDNGSGSAVFVNELSSLRSDVSVVNLNPTFSQRDFRKNRVFPQTDIEIAALNPELPFKPESFDVTLDVFASVRFAAQVGASPLKMIDELIRVTKKGGLIAAGPMPMGVSLDEVEKHLSRKKGLRFTIRKGGISAIAAVLMERV
jgi:SAM-dependent methyltransferase